jgi:tetratricopeptide (TPR) repeat protein
VKAPPATPQVTPVVVAPQPAAPAVPPDIRDMTNPGYLIDLAGVHMRYGALDRAEPLLRGALEKANPQQKQQAYQTMAQLMQRKNDWKGAVECYEGLVAAVTTPLEKSSMTLGLADAYIHNNEPDKAEKLLNEIPPTPKDHPEQQWIQQRAFQLLSQILQSKPGRLDQYITDAEAALVKTPDDAILIDRLAEIYSNLKRDPAKALPYLEKLSTLRPDDRFLQQRIIWNYQQSRQFDKAIELYKKMIANPGARKEDVHQNNLQIGFLLLQAGKKDDAVAWVRENYAKDMLSVQDNSMMAIFFDQAQMVDEAEACLNKLAEGVKTPQEKADAKVRMAELQLRKHDFAKATELAQAVLNEFKDNLNASQRANGVIKRAEVEKENAARLAQAQKDAAAKAAEQPKEAPKPATPAEQPKEAAKPAEQPKEAAPAPAPAKEAPPAPAPEKKEEEKK